MRLPTMVKGIIGSTVLLSALSTGAAVANEKLTFLE